MLPPTARANPKSPVLQIRIQDQGSGAFLTLGFGIWDPGPGSRMGQNLYPGWKTRIIYLGAEKPFFGLKYLNSLMRIRYPGSENGKNLDQGSWIWDGKNLDPGSRMEKI